MPHKLKSHGLFLIALCSAIGAIAFAVVVANFAVDLHRKGLRGGATGLVATALQSEPITLDQLRRQYGERLKEIECDTPRSCYAVTISNRLEAALGLGPYTELQSSFYLSGGVVREDRLDYLTQVDVHHSVVAHVQVEYCPTCQSFSIDPWAGSAPLQSNGIVEIGAELPESSKLVALSLDTTCLVRSGCSSIADLLPSVWMVTTNQRIACRLSTDKGWVARPLGGP
jgi:hypothetical protein